jgi:cell division protein FtsB
VLAFAWLCYAGFISDHSFYRIWRLEQESERSTTDLVSARGERERKEEENRDPAARRQHAEELLRVKNGMARPGEIIYQIREVPAESLGR